MARRTRGPDREKSELSLVSRDSFTIAGEALEYLGTPRPEISSFVMRIAPGAKSSWMTHPVPVYVYVLEGTLTVEFADGTHREFSAGQAFLQTRTKWHNGANHGKGPMRFLAVFAGAKDVPTVLPPPTAKRRVGSSRT